MTGLHKCRLLRDMHVLGCLIAGLLFLNQAALAASGEPELPDAELAVIESNQQGILLELSVGDFVVESLEHTGQLYARVNIAGMQQTTIPGAPQVPSRGALLGVPTTAGLEVRVLESDDEIFTGYKLYPAPQLEVTGEDFEGGAGGVVRETFALDAERYTTDAFYPAAPVELGEVGYLRAQAAVQIILYPVQYNPVRGEIRVHHRLRVQVTWAAPIAPARAENRTGNATYENLLRQTLLNYDSIPRPTAPGVEASMAATSPVLVASSTSGPALKVGVNADGLYRLTYSDLLNAGFDPNLLDPRTLKLHNRGAEVALYVAGEDDGIFDGSDYVLFYGTALHDAYTTLNVYWLSAGGNAGHRMATRVGAPISSAAAAFQSELFFPLIAPRQDPLGIPITVPHSFPALVHAEEDTTYWQTMLGIGEDRWFWGKRLGPNTNGIPASRSYNLMLHNVSPEGTASLRVRLKGYTGLGHHTRIYLNGRLLDDRLWNGQMQFTQQAYLSQSLLREGENTVMVETLDAGATVDQILVNWFELDYWDRYVAENNQLLFAAPTTGRFRFEVDGFTQADVEVFDVTDAANPVQIANPLVSSQGRLYRVSFEDSAWATTRYLALSTGQYKSPASLVLDQPSLLKSSANGADYIIITHEDFYTSALVLAEHRRATGLRVATVRVGDIYDEFNAGIFNPNAIRDFLAYAFQNWQAPAPTFVLLLGDANQDYKDNLKNGTSNYVPSQNIESSLFGEVSSDNGFASVSGDDKLPDLLIGRLVAQSSQEAADMVDKIIRYDLAPPDASWNKSVLFVADDDETIFKTISDRLATRLPFYYTVSRVYIAGYPPGNPKQDILSYINSGTVLVNYAGHGEYFGWGTWKYNQESIFDLATVDRLTNSNKLAVITVANCLNGFFAGPKDKPALAEVLQRRRDGGGVGIWAPTSMEYPTGHSILLSNFYDAIFLNDQRTLGAATTAAKLATLAQSNFWQEMIDTYVLFGDPATEIGIPTNYPYVVATSPANGADGVPLDQRLRIVFNKPMAPNTVVIAGATVNGMKFTPIWSQNNTVVDLAPSGFAHGQTYEVVISGDDRQGNTLGTGTTPNPWSFTVTHDDVAPNAVVEVQGGNPAAVMSKAVLTVSFSEPVRPNSVTYTITPAVKGALIWEANGQRATFRHNDFQEGETYVFSVLTAQDVGGNWLNEPARLEFTVAPTFYFFLPGVFALGHLAWRAYGTGRKGEFTSAKKSL